MATKKAQKQPEIIAVRFSAEDHKLAAAIKAHLGVLSLSDVIRQSLRALAAKEGIAA